MSSHHQTREQALEPGVEVAGFLITRVLGIGGFGVTYEASDTTLNRKVAVKEYFPGGLAVRDNDGRTISALGSDRENFFEYGLRRFLDEARTLAQFNHPNIVHVNRFIECNGTAYLIMDYEEGESLEDLLRRRRRLSVAETHPILVSVMRGLRTVHERQYLHRDVKPDNIFLRNTGAPLLLDFGSARQSLNNQHQSMTVVLTPGYAPIEQYAEEEQQGPPSDLYAAGATAFRCLVGRHPPESTARLHAIHSGSADPAPVQLKEACPDDNQQFLSLIEQLMQPLASDRPQSALDVLRVLDEIGNDCLDPEAPTMLKPGLARPEPVAHVPTIELTPSREPAFTLSEEQRARLSILLAESLGPIANILIRKAVSKATSSTELLQALAEELDDSERARFLADARDVFSSD